jgi:large subunit ribosomal protein L5
MYFLKNYYQSVIQYDLINKFQYKNLQNLPKLQKIVLNFGYKDFKILASSLLSLEFITTKRGTVTIANNSHILLKIRKGNPAGCKVILKKTLMYHFFTKLLVDVFPQMKEFQKFNLQFFLFQPHTFSYQLKNTLNFFELEQNYNLFSSLSNLNITIVTNTKTHKELLFLLNSFKFSINFKLCERNSIG